MIIIWAPEDTGEVHTGNNLQYIKTPRVRRFYQV